MKTNGTWYSGYGFSDGSGSVLDNGRLTGRVGSVAGAL